MSSTAGLQVRFSLEPRQRDGQWVNVEYIRIISMGDKFNQPHRPVEPADKVRFAADYERWKKGLEEPAEGQPLRTWPGISPAEVNVLAQAGIATVEALADAPDGAVGDGPYLALRESARRYLSLSGDTAALQQLEARAAETEAENESLRERLAEMERKFASAGTEEAPAPSPKPPKQRKGSTKE
jgi:hypothetical protein